MADGTESAASAEPAGPGKPEEQILALDARLKEAIRQEEYELAARYQDEIRALEKRGKRSMSKWFEQTDCTGSNVV